MTVSATPKTLSEADRQQILSGLTEAHNTVSNLVSELRRRYSAKLPAVKAAAKTERQLFQLKREIEKMDVEKTGREGLPAVTRAGKAVDLYD